MHLKIKCLGADANILTQLPRIIDGFKKLGHEIVDENPDLIYVNDKGYHNQGIEFKKKYPNAKLILNVLDIPFHCKEVNEIINELNINFFFADAVTTISDTVRKQMLSIFPNLQKNGIGVIYQPIKPVKPLNLKRTLGASIFGRQLDPNKNCDFSVKASFMSGIKLNIIGPENIVPFLNNPYKDNCSYKGLVTDIRLNTIYNKSNVVLITSGVEGLCLPLIESLVTKTPVVCVNSMYTSIEFCPKEFICEPSIFSIVDKIKYVTSGSMEILDLLNKFSESYLNEFSPTSVCNRILKTYERIRTT